MRELGEEKRGMHAGSETPAGTAISSGMLRCSMASAECEGARTDAFQTHRHFGRPCHGAKLAPRLPSETIQRIPGSGSLLSLSHRPLWPPTTQRLLPAHVPTTPRPVTARHSSSHTQALSPAAGRPGGTPPHCMRLVRHSAPALRRSSAPSSQTTAQPLDRGRHKGAG